METNETIEVIKTATQAVVDALLDYPGVPDLFNISGEVTLLTLWRYAQRFLDVEFSGHHLSDANWQYVAFMLKQRLADVYDKSIMGDYETHYGMRNAHGDLLLASELVMQHLDPVNVSPVSVRELSGIITDIENDMMRMGNKRHVVITAYLNGQAVVTSHETRAEAEKHVIQRGGIASPTWIHLVAKHFGNGVLTSSEWAHVRMEDGNV
jgi:hypothetical protein